MVLATGTDHTMLHLVVRLLHTILSAVGSALFAKGATFITADTSNWDRSCDAAPGG